MAEPTDIIADLGVLPARPPTPPKASPPDGVPSSANRPIPVRFQASHDAISSSPPRPQPPPSARVGPATQSKRVNFSPMTSIITPPDFSDPNRLETPTKAPFLDKTDKPIKSILKPSTPSPFVATPDNPPPSDDATESSEAMLRSVMEQLAGDCGSSRRDAYMILARSWKTYVDMPDRDAFAANVPQLSRYLHRDLLDAGPEEFDPQRINFVHQALNVLVIVLCRQETLMRVPEDLKKFFLEHSITCLQNPRTPKSIVVGYLRVLSEQDFPTKIMNHGRISQILVTLQELTDRTDGKAIIAQRLSVYHRLLTQSRSVFTSHANHWITHLIHAMMNPIKEIRERAITFGLKIAFSVGPSTSISHALRDAFKISVENDNETTSTMFENVCEGLVEMITLGSSQATQIWSVVILLLRDQKWPLSQWSQYKTWLLVVERAFNSSESGMKSQAFAAWNQFIYASLPCDSLGPETLKIFIRPIISRLCHRKADKQSSLVELSLRSYYRLLHRALHPSTSYERLDLYWKEFVSNPFSTSMGCDPVNNARACRVFSALLWNPVSKVWDDSPAVSLDLTDIPRLDCKWVRSRVSLVVATFEALLRNASWKSSIPAETDIGVAWIHFCKALADAASKEVTISSDSMQALAVVLGMLNRVWKGAPESLNATRDDGGEATCQRFSFLLSNLVIFVRPSVLIEKLLLKTPEEAFHLPQTPRHRPPTDKNVLPPILHLFRTICTFTPFQSRSKHYYQLVNTFLDLSLQSRTSRDPRVEILRLFSDLVFELRSAPETKDSLNLQYIWQAIAAFTKDALGSSATLNANQVAELQDVSTADRLGENGDCQKTIKILFVGIIMPAARASWVELFESLITMVKFEIGDAALGPILESFAERLTSQSVFISTVYAAAYCSLLLKGVVVPANWNQVPRGPPHSPRTPQSHHSRPQSEPSPIIPCDKLLTLANDLLTDIYRNMKEMDVDTVSGFLQSLHDFFLRCPATFLPISLTRLQDGLSLWFSDKDNVLSQHTGCDSSVIHSVRTKHRIIGVSLGRNDKNQLN